MPAINVARTDTFEQQRVKINDISQAIFNITAGGSDLATGKLRIGDGTKAEPSLSFENDTTVGIYRANVGVLGFVAQDKKILNIDSTQILAFQDFNLQKNIVAEAIISNAGANYDAGIYQDVFVNGGNGNALSLDIEVIAHDGVINNTGEGYTPGTYNDIPPTGGNGSGASLNFTVPEIEGTITSAGSAYAPGNYSNVLLTSAQGGTGARADIVITGDVEYNGSITNGGSGYTEGTYTAVGLFGQPTTTYTATAVSNPGTPPPSEVYAINGNTQQALNLLVGNTYRFDVSDASMGTHPLRFQNQDGTPLDPTFFDTITVGAGGVAGAFVDLVIKIGAPTTAIEYYCTNHPNMGAAINLSSGSVGDFGSGLTVDIVVDANGIVTGVTVNEAGTGYAPNDVLTAEDTILIGPGSNFEYTLGGSFTYTGTVNSLLFTDQGSGYEQGDTLSVADSNVGGAGGAGFLYTITSNPGSVTNLFWQDRGNGYQVGDVLNLSPAVNGLATTLSGTTSDVTGSCSTASTTITVAATTGIVAGMAVTGTGLDANTTVVSIASATEVVVSLNPISDEASTTFTFTGPNQNDVIEVVSVAGIFPGMLVEVASGAGVLQPNTTVASIDAANNAVTLSQDAETPGNAVVNFVPPYGAGTTAWEYEVDRVGVIDTIGVNNPGNGYEIGNELTVDPSLLIQPESFAVTNQSLTKLTFTTPPAAGTFTTSDRITTDGAIFFEVRLVSESGGTTNYLLVENALVNAGDDIETEANSGTTYEVGTSDSVFRYSIDGSLEPNIVLYVGSQYTFDLSDSSNQGHLFALSEFRDGNYEPSLVDNVTTDITAGSAEITVTAQQAADILPRMAITQTSGSGIPSGTTVVSVDTGTNVVTMSNAALISATGVVLDFAGAEYVDGVTRTSDSLTIIVRDTTPSLYYYCASGPGHENEGGENGEEILLTVDPNNPKVFGSNALFVVSDITTSNSIGLDIVEGEVTASTITTTDGVVGTLQSTDFTSATGTFSTSLATPLLNREGANFELKANSFIVTAGINVSDKLTISNTTGNLETSGYVKISDYLLVDNLLKIDTNTISTITQQDIVLQPSVGQLVKCDATSAFVVPAGTTIQRPGAATAIDGSIRYNTQTEQYEGYNANNQSWSSLGGVRDLDGNTYILAEETTGANDNTLWFINDNINTMKFTPNYMEFVNVKKARSLNVSAPAFVEWRANVPVALGEFVKYKNNLYEVTVGGTTGTSGAEPIHTSGAVANGSAELTWSQIAVAPITFEDYEEFRFDPFGSSPVRINNNLKFQEATISTTVDDLVLAPNSGKKIVCDAATTLALPVGADADRGVPVQGSVRFSTTSTQFEGYDGTNWGSLGGVKDVDQNTYIIPESSPGANENTLFFYNDGQKSAEMTTTAFDLYAIDTVRSMTSDEFELTASLLTIDQAATTLDNTSTTTTFLHSSKQYFDIGLSAGVTVDPILRLDDQGDVYFNTTFGSGFSGVKIFDSELKEFELADFRILTEKITLIKGSIDNGGSEIYDTATEESAKVVVTAHNPTTNDKQMIEFGCIDDGSDVYYTEYNNLLTGIRLFEPTFEYTANNTVRLNISVGDDVGGTQNVKITVVSHITKK
tara:strand:+ start:23336 stop:28162 length:4827 start_codon:yes stop_codon:yes gene_type:complete